MPNEATPLFIADVSAFTKSLRKQLADQQELPGHAGMLALVAKSAGYRNHQHLRSGTSAPRELDELALKRARRVFDETGRMTRWPKQTKVQGLCLWPFWASMPSHQEMTETEVNEVLQQGMAFEDHVLLRRSLIDHELATREVDGSVYRRVERKPTPEALALIAFVRGK